MKASGTDLSTQLDDTAAQLRQLEEKIKGQKGGVELRILMEFRQAVDQIRLTTWAVQKWLDLSEQHQDQYGPLALLIAERIRRSAQLNNDLARDLSRLGTLPDTEGVADLRTSVERLLRCLEPLSSNQKRR